MSHCLCCCLVDLLCRQVYWLCCCQKHLAKNYPIRFVCLFVFVIKPNKLFLLINYRLRKQNSWVKLIKTLFLKHYRIQDMEIKTTVYTITILTTEQLNDNVPTPTYASVFYNVFIGSSYK